MIRFLLLMFSWTSTIVLMHSLDSSPSSLYCQAFSSSSLSSLSSLTNQFIFQNDRNVKFTKKTLSSSSSSSSSLSSEKSVTFKPRIQSSHTRTTLLFLNSIDDNDNNNNNNKKEDEDLVEGNSSIGSVSSRLVQSILIGIVLSLVQPPLLPFFSTDLSNPNNNGVSSFSSSTSSSFYRPSNTFMNTAWAMTESQLLVDDVWREVTRQFVDTSLTENNPEWKVLRQKTLEQVGKLPPILDDDDDGNDDDMNKQNSNAILSDDTMTEDGIPRVTANAYPAIRTMLQALKDPYTRFLTPTQYASLVSYAKDGTTTTTSSSSNNNNQLSIKNGDQRIDVSGGIGVQLLADPRSGQVVVMNVIPEGPAAQSGILPGDIIESVNGQPASSLPAEVVATKCRGPIGSNVQVEILRSSNEDENKNNKNLATLLSRKTIDLTRAAIKKSVPPFQVSKFTIESTDGNTSTVGVMTLKSFNQQTFDQVLEALRGETLTSSNILVLDLRGNLGGYMPAGVDVAKIFLPARSRIISEVDKAGRATIYINDGVGRSDTERPLYLLVDERTASASEILAAALQDNHRATILSSFDRTFGKGRIQNIQPLFDGSGIAVTKAKYVTPSGKDIQGVGIIPDRKIASCGLSDSAARCLRDVLL